MLGIHFRLMATLAVQLARGKFARRSLDGSQSMVTQTSRVLDQNATLTSAAFRHPPPPPPSLRLQVHPSVMILVVLVGVVTHAPGSVARIATLMGSWTWFAMTVMAALGSS